MSQVSGLTLVEVLMSVVVLAVGAVAVMQALARVAQAQAIADQQTAAYLFTLSKMAEIELAVREGRELEEVEEGGFRSGIQPFEWTVTATPLLDDPEATTVSLALAWRSGERTYEQRIDTLLRAPLRGEGKP